MKAPGVIAGIAVVEESLNSLRGDVIPASLGVICWSPQEALLILSEILRGIVAMIRIADVTVSGPLICVVEQTLAHCRVREQDFRKIGIFESKRCMHHDD